MISSVSGRVLVAVEYGCEDSKQAVATLRACLKVLSASAQMTVTATIAEMQTLALSGIVMPQMTRSRVV